MPAITICIGSACHLKGAHAILNAFVALFTKYNLDGKVELGGCFCQGRCTEGVVIRVGDETITNVSVDRVFAIFQEKVLKEAEQ